MGRGAHRGTTMIIIEQYNKENLSSFNQWHSSAFPYSKVSIFSRKKTFWEYIIPPCKERHTWSKELGQERDHFSWFALLPNDTCPTQHRDLLQIPVYHGPSPALGLFLHVWAQPHHHQLCHEVVPRIPPFHGHCCTVNQKLKNTTS